MFETCAKAAGASKTCGHDPLQQLQGTMMQVPCAAQPGEIRAASGYLRLVSCEGIDR